MSLENVTLRLKPQDKWVSQRGTPVQTPRFKKIWGMASAVRSTTEL